VKGQERKAIIHVCPQADLPEGNFVDTLLLSVSQSNIEIPVRGRIVESVTISPRVVYFPQDSSLQKRVLVRRFDGKELGSLLKFQGPDGLSISEVASDNGKNSRLFLLELARKRQAGNFHEKVLFWFSGEKNPISIEILGFGG
jgi:hypothetical protein